MISELKEKIRGLNKVVDRYQRGRYSERKFKRVLNEQMEKTWGSKEVSCGNPHNNADESCLECEVIKNNI